MAVAELTDLNEAMDVAVKVDFAACTPRERREAVASIARLESQLLALRAEIVGAFERENDWAGYGYTSPAAGVREIAKVPMKQARQSVSLDVERLLSSRFIRSPEYGTRACSVLSFERNGRIEFSEQNYLDAERSGASSFEIIDIGKPD